MIARVGGNAVVNKSVPDGWVTVAGVPAKVVGKCSCEKPSDDMDQQIL